jgi:hypothetical protein
MSPSCAAPAKSVDYNLNRSLIAGPLFRDGTADVSFYEKITVDGINYYPIGSWNGPVKWALIRSLTKAPMSSADSVNVKAGLDSLSRALCGIVQFVPAMESEVMPRNGLRIYLEPAGITDYGGVDQWNTGDYFSGVTIYANSDEMANIKIVQHETIHALGKGHTCEWRSIMYSCFPTPLDWPYSIAPEDVVYILAIIRIRELERKYHNHCYSSLAQAIQGERVFELNLPEEKVGCIDENGNPLPYVGRP